MAQTKREYLVERNLAKPGRGRFSREALAILANAEAEGVVFSETSKPEKEEDSPAPLLRPAPVDKIMRKQKIAWATVILATGRTIPVQLGYCGKCQSRVSFCSCSKGPRIPSWIDQSLSPASLTPPEGI
jgi:hypothetical protein